MKKLCVLGLMLAMLLVGTTDLFAKDEFIIFHYWTAGGEKEAIDELFKLFKAKHPEVEVLENPVAGGGGAHMLAVLMGNLESGNPPDIFQDHQGNQQTGYIKAGYLEEVNDLWERENFESRINEVWVKTLKFDGKVYSVPINAHRTNWLWYNKPIFDELGLKPPETYDELLETCKKIKEAKPDVFPLSLGTREKVWSTYIYDMCLVAAGGPDFYEKANTGLIDFRNDPTFRDAMEKIGLAVPKSAIVHTIEATMDAADDIGFPIIVRPSFTLGGTGGGVAYNRQELKELATAGLDLSMTTEIMIERSLLGWKEYELEVMRDKNDNVVIIACLNRIIPAVGRFQGRDQSECHWLTCQVSYYNLTW